MKQPRYRFFEIQLYGRSESGASISDGFVDLSEEVNRLTDLGFEFVGMQLREERWADDSYSGGVRLDVYAVVTMRAGLHVHTEDKT